MVKYINGVDRFFTLMKIPALLIASLGFISFNAMSSTNFAIASPSSSALEYANLLDDVGNASVSVLTKLGYDCKTASAGGILCTKCKEDGFKKKCEAFTCDAVTKKCRRKTADLPNIPGSNDDESDDDGVKLPSL